MTVHYTRSAESPYPLCSAGYGRGNRRRRMSYTQFAVATTCKVCLKVIATRYQGNPPTVQETAP